MRASTAETSKKVRARHALTKEVQRQQLKSRKAGREVLQYVCSQALPESSDKELLHELAECNPEIKSEFTMQQSLKYKDPSKETSMCAVCSQLTRAELQIFL